MAKNKAIKTELLNKYKEMLSNVGGYILVDTSNLDTASITNLKKKLTEIGSSYTVVKNSVFKIALSETEQPLQTQEFEGPTAVISYDEDPTAPAKLLKELRKSLKSETPVLSPRFATLKGEYISAERTMELSEIPSREVLLAKLLGTLNAPLSGFMNAVTGNVRGFTMIVKQLSEK